MIFIGVFIPVFTIALSVILYILGDSSFSIFTHYLSHLGIGPNGSNIVFNLGCMISGVVMVFFFLNLSVFLIKRDVPRYLVKMSFIFGFVSSIGIFLIGVFPGDGSQVLHNIVASLFFLGGLANCVLYGISERKAKGISKLQAHSGFVVAFFFIVFIIITSLYYYYPKTTLELSHFSEWILLNYYLPKITLELSHFSEWILMALIIFWIIGHEVMMIKGKKK